MVARGLGRTVSAWVLQRISCESPSSDMTACGYPSQSSRRFVLTKIGFHEWYYYAFDCVNGRVRQLVLHS